MLKHISIVFIFFLSPSLVQAANVGTGSVKITKMENWVGASGLYIKTDQSQLTNPAGCSSTDKYHLATTASDISQSMILSAYIAGKLLNFVIFGGGCSDNRPQIVAVSFQD